MIEIRTRFENREVVRGLLAGFVTTDEPQRDYEGMNRALKSRVEDAVEVDERQ